MKVASVTQHAIDRYLQRSGGKKEMKAIGKLFSIADNAVPIGKNRFYSNGWIIAVWKGEIKTVYRPKTVEQMESVHNAISK